MTSVGLVVAMGLERVKLLLRLQSFDGLTSAGRAGERHRRAALTALAAALARSLSIATALITVPLTLHYLGTERYGMWMTMSTLVAMLSFADLGIGNGILNAVSTAYGKDDFVAIREYVSSGLFALSAVAVGIVVIFAGLYKLVPWHEIFNVNSIQARKEAGPSLAVLIACFASAIPLGVVQRLQMGLQRGFMANLWQCFSSLLALCCVILAIRLEAGLPWLVLAFAGSPLIASLFNSVVYFCWVQPETAPVLKSVSCRAMRHVAGIGVLFFVLQIAGTAAYSSDNIVIAQILGANAVPVYAVPQRLFSIISMLLMMVLAPLWPAYGEAIARGDHTWVTLTLKRSLLISIGFATAASALLVTFGSPLIRLWVGNVIIPSTSLLLGMGVWQIALAAGGALAMYLNGANIVRFQMVIATMTAISGILLKILLVKSIGVSGAVWASVLAFSVFSAVPIYFVIIKRMAPTGRS